MAVEAQAERVLIPKDVHAAIREIADRTGRDLSEVAAEMLTEAVQMRQCPGIVFADGPTGRRARIAGTGIEVFEVIRAHRTMGEDWTSLRNAFNWLSEEQLRPALGYAEANADRVERFLADDEREEEVLEAFWAAHPAAKPH